MAQAAEDGPSSDMSDGSAGDYQSPSENPIFRSAPARAVSKRMLPVLNEMSDSLDLDDLSIVERLLRTSKSSPANPTYRRTKSLAGPSPVCRFGPKAQLFHTDTEVACVINDPGTTRLNWSSFPQTVLVVKKARDVDVLEPFVELLHCLLKKDMTVFIERAVLSEEHLLTNKEFVLMNKRLSTFDEHSDQMHGRIDFIICLGGDGTLLYASSLFQTSVPPVMAFHLGSLGFLTPFEFEDIENRIDAVLRGHANLTLRSRLHTVISKKRICSKQQINGSADGTPASSQTDDETEDSEFVVLNDVVIDRGPSPYLVNIDLFVDGIHITSVQGFCLFGSVSGVKLVNDYYEARLEKSRSTLSGTLARNFRADAWDYSSTLSGDGLIISTPTGSTAYAVAAGASIVHPGVPAIMITPICPHSLSFRPVMVPGGCELKLMISQNARDHGWVSFDGRNRQKLDYEDVLTITTSVYPLPSICQSDQVQDWFTGLAACLNWNVRKQQKPLNNGHDHGHSNGKG